MVEASGQTPSALTGFDELKIVSPEVIKKAAVKNFF